MVNRTRLKGLLRSSGLGRFYYPNHPVNTACGMKPECGEEVYDCRLTAPSWRESLRSYALRRFYNPNHPVNIACGRKPEYPEEIYDCRLTAPGWRQSLRSYGLRDFIILTILLTLPVGGNRSTRRKSTTVGRAFTNSSHKCHKSEVGIEPTISEVIGACSDDCATWSLLCRTKQSYTRNLNSLALDYVSL